MKLYTSYFYQIRFFPRNLIPLSTVVWPPKYELKDSTGQCALVIDCPPLKPGAACEGLCRGTCSPKHPQDCEFLRVYRKQLETIDLSQFIHKLEKLKKIIEEQEHIENVNFAFIVFESNKNPCSERVMIQDWLQSHGIAIEEWQSN